MQEARSYECLIDGHPLTISTGVLAGQADGAVTVRFGDTLILVTACMENTPRPGIDFLPLTVDYEERLYAAGKIPGSFFRREGRPGQDATLTARLTDRPLRPLFPKGFYNDIQIVITVLSADMENDPAALAIVGASAALSISRIPFFDPVGAVTVGYIDGRLVLNPTFSELDISQLDLVVAGTRDSIVMVEAGASEVAEELMLDAIRYGHEASQALIDLQERMVRDIGKPKMRLEEPQHDDALDETIRASSSADIEPLLLLPDRAERERRLELIKAKLTEQLAERFAPNAVAEAFDGEVKRQMRSLVLNRSVRVGGRSMNDLRTISCEVGVLPRTHGSGLFNRGRTQVLSIATLGPIGRAQVLDSLTPDETKRFMHHYNYPPFSNGEARRIGSPSRREIGHGALAERALEPVIPTEGEFPYTIRLVSEVLSSDGSTSMGSVCGSTLALMDAGVPIKAPVSGVAMGLILGEDGRYAVLTDIEATEDFLGDMDFKVPGTAAGITALQMDVKVKGLTIPILQEALNQARAARLKILDIMQTTIDQPRGVLSPYAPRMYTIHINPEKIRYVIGPGGRTIRSIMEETKVTIDVENDGTVVIGSASEEAAAKATQMIESLTREVKIGEIYTGKVARIAQAGVFVEILPGQDGLVRLRDLADFPVARAEDVVKIGDDINVMVIEVDRQGRVNLSRRAAITGVMPTPEELARARDEDRPPRRDGPGGPPRRGGDGYGGGRFEPRPAPRPR